MNEMNITTKCPNNIRLVRVDLSIDDDDIDELRDTLLRATPSIDALSSESIMTALSPSSFKWLLSTKLCSVFRSLRTLSSYP